MSTELLYSFQVSRIKRGTENARAEVSYSALPLEARAALESGWRDRLGLQRWCPLEPRLDSPVQVPTERLREIAREMLADISEVWEGTGVELVVVVSCMQAKGRLVERARVEKSDARRRRESVARKLGKGTTHSRHGITLEGTYDRHCTWEDADRFVRSRLTEDELREFPVQWHRNHGWDNFDNQRNSWHRVFADAAQLLDDRTGWVGSTAWQAVRGTLSPAVAETIEVLSDGWTGTGAELLAAARKLTEEVKA